MKIVLLQPPAIDHRRYVRDVYCAGLVKGVYAWPPLDLVMVSGVLAQEHEVSALDAQAERLSAEQTLERLVAEKPDVTVFITSSASRSLDFSFMETVKTAQPRTRLVMMGDLALTRGVQTMRAFSFLDGAILNYFDPGVARAFGEAGLRPARNMAVRIDGEILSDGPVSCDTPNLPAPRHDLFPLHSYQAPWARRRWLTTTATSYGCPFRCAFCAVGDVDYAARPVDDLIKELRFAHSAGVREVYFQDFLFTVDKKRTLALCRALRDARLDLSWCCLSKVGTYDSETLSAMRGAGCHTIQLGLESGSDRILNTMGKGFRVSDTEDACSQCRDAGIRVDAIFMLGYPDESEAEMEETVRLALRLPLHMVTFVIVTPGFGTRMVEEWERKGGEIDWNRSYDDAENVLAMGDVDSDKLRRLRDRAERRFYLRPVQVLRLAGSTRSLTELRWKTEEAFGFLRGCLSTSRR